MQSPRRLAMVTKGRAKEEADESEMEETVKINQSSGSGGKYKQIISLRALPPTVTTLDGWL